MTKNINSLQIFILAFVIVGHLANAADYLPLNLGENVEKCVFSPAKKHIVVTYKQNPVAKVWDLSAGTIVGEIKKEDFHFFSQDGSKIFSIGHSQIYQHELGNLGLLKSFNAALHWYDYKACYIESDNSIVKFHSRIPTSHDHGVFISRMLPDLTIKTSALDIHKMGFWINSLEGPGGISADSNFVAFSCARCSYGYPYFHVLNIPEQKAIFTCIFSDEHIRTIDFSPSNSKVILTVIDTSWGKRLYWFILIDLETNTMMWFKQNQPPVQASFIDEQKIAVILEDGTLSYHELTESFLNERSIADESKCRVLPKGQVNQH